MAVLDVLIRDKSFISSANLETTIMWLKNKPSIYLSEMWPEERDRALNEETTTLHASKGREKIWTTEKVRREFTTEAAKKRGERNNRIK